MKSHLNVHKDEAPKQDDHNKKINLRKASESQRNLMHIVQKVEDSKRTVATLKSTLRPFTM